MQETVTVNVPTNWIDHLFNPSAIKFTLGKCIRHRNRNDIKDVLEHVEGDEYLFSCNGQFYSWDILSEQLCAVIEPKGKAELWEPMDEDLKKVSLKVLPPSYAA
ncbi:uncharacterized protein EDB91DRAFT_1060173 [Suillus paluster]|uniref:uncharacterized protein n=1 Tax=Suillus paluster TaxID=48578 RepID=UPI001B85DFB3|nr:uncharacterized protein EDB91DRAFT_1060173 [Suillus paluster]KAG1729092.1 hypothetical protein EDB91DRAFT_1060173 [Suillus paluster]